MKKEISTMNAPGAIGPYSQAIAVENAIYCSGQLPINPITGEMGKDIAEMTTLSLKNLKGILAENGMTMEDVVKTTVFMIDLADFGEMNRIYESFFHEPYPARSAVQVAALPKGAKIEIECIAVRE